MEHSRTAVGVAAILDGDGERSATGKLVQERAAAGRGPGDGRRGRGQPSEDAGVDEQSRASAGSSTITLPGEVIPQELPAAAGAEHVAALGLERPRAARLGSRSLPPSPRCDWPGPRGPPGHGIVAKVMQQLLDLRGGEAEVVPRRSRSSSPSTQAGQVEVGRDARRHDQAAATWGRSRSGGRWLASAGVLLEAKPLIMSKHGLGILCGNARPRAVLSTVTTPACLGPCGEAWLEVADERGLPRPTPPPPDTRRRARRKARRSVPMRGCWSLRRDDRSGAA